MPTIGAQLKQARAARRLSIQQVVDAIRIRDYYLEAMEADDFSSMPSAVQARGFFRSYADFLGLDADGLLDLQRQENTLPAEFITLLSQGQEASSSEPAVPAPAPAPLPEPATPEPEPEPEEVIPEPDPEPQQPAGPPMPAPVSQMIFAEIGHELRQRRELLSLTLDEIERHTRVRKHYLEKIEAGNYDELPSPVQARGMLSNYASFLDVDPDVLLLRFADALQARRLERQPASASRSSMPRPRFALPPWLGRFISPDLLFGGGMILLLFFLTLWGAVRIFSGAGAPATNTQGPSISDILLATPSPAAITGSTPAPGLPTSVPVVIPTNTDTPGASTVQTDTPQAGDNSPGVQVTISILERTFVRVTVDGQVKLEGRVAPGAALPFQGNTSIEILTGSGSAIQVLYNQQTLGPMGDFGEVVDRIYTAAGIETPTATSSPTVTLTPRFQKTPTLTPTVTPTRTVKK